VHPYVANATSIILRCTHIHNNGLLHITGLEYDPKHPGVRKCTMQIQVSDLNETLVSLKLRMLDQAYLKGHILPVDKNTPDAWRFRSTDWLAEPDELIQEYSIDTTTATATPTTTTSAAASSATGGTAKQSSKSSKARVKQEKETAASATAVTGAADASTVQSELPSVKYVAKAVGDSVIASDSCELVLLEQGRCVKPNEVEIPLYLWIPHDEAMQHGLSYDVAVAAGLEIPPLQSQLDDDALQRVIDADSASDTSDATSDEATAKHQLLKKITKVAQQGLDTPGRPPASMLMYAVDCAHYCTHHVHLSYAFGLETHHKCS
jgi:hypothetical protein